MKKLKERRRMLARPRQGHLLRGRAMRTPMVGVARRGRRSCPLDKKWIVRTSMWRPHPAGAPKGPVQQ